MTGAFFASMTTRAYDTIILNGTCAYGCGQPVYKDPVLLVSDKLCYLCQMMRLQANDHKHYIKVGNISTYPETAGMRPIWRNGVHIGWKCTGSEHSGPCNFIRTDATLPTNRTYQFN